LATVNTAQINLKYSRSKSPNKVKRIENIANRRIKDAREEFFAMVNDDKVISSLETGGDGGYDLPGGSLRGFLGIKESLNPSQDFIGVLDKNIKRGRVRISQSSTQNEIGRFSINFPSENQIYEATPDEWKGSWVESIIDGLSGLERFLYFKITPTSRSQEGSQASKKLRNTSDSIPSNKNFIADFRNMFSKISKGVFGRRGGRTKFQ
jgi:hypothetical protein